MMMNPLLFPLPAVLLTHIIIMIQLSQVLELKELRELKELKTIAEDAQ